MADYVNPPLEADADALENGAYNYLRERVSGGWEPADGNLDVWLIQAFALIAAQVAEVASDVPASIFRYYGAKIANVPPLDATLATTTVKVTALPDDPGRTGSYRMDAGTTVAFPDPSGGLVAFEVAADVEIPVGATVATGVPITAVEAGASGTGLAGEALQLDPLDWVQAIETEAATAGGQDAEPDSVYLARLVEELRLLAPRPILPQDFAVLAKRVNGVARATALDGYNPADATTGNARMVTVALADAAGHAVPQTVKDQVRALLEGQREIGFLVPVIDPTYTTVTVDFTVKVYPDFIGTEVVERVKAAVAALLSPASWGNPAYGDQLQWINDTKVRYLEVAQAVNNVEGVHYIDTLTVNGGGADVTLTGAAPLPQAGAITGAAI